MRYSLSLILGLLIAHTSFGQTKQVESGWLQLFDGTTTYGWRTRGPVVVQKPMLQIGGTTAATATTTTEFGNWELRFDYLAAVSINSPSLLLGDKTFSLRPLKKGWHDVKLRLENGTLSGRVNVKVNGRFGVTVRIAGKFPRRGTLGFSVPPGTRLTLKNIKLKPFGMKSIFNGKDLTGWKVFPGRKSKFTVKDGVLNIKDGNGDIQTTGSYKDFILQLDCISHGDNLNSGVFFRCLPNQYQQGYEAQIRNQFTPMPKQEYSLQIYDPKTHKLVETIKKKYTAVDYGTGGIYRRQPARLEIAKDNEWFTMTVMANGNHFSTWVNGIQVTDWTDNRPLADNARKGTYLKGGPISLQGHDPTTNLSFRNFYVVELPSK